MTPTAPSDTPRTDRMDADFLAVTGGKGASTEQYHEFYMRARKIARQGERELNALRAKQSSEARAVPEGLIDALRDQKQCDEDGTECQVSRQAVDEAIAILESLAAAPASGKEPK